MDMVDRVAQAIFADPLIKEDEISLVACRFLARAAIEAMRCPTDAMIAEGGEVIPSDGCSHGRDRRDAEEVWRAMIDAALGETPPLDVVTKD